MKDTRLIMGMPITVEIVDSRSTTEDLEAVFGHFERIDRQYSPFKPDSEVGWLNQGVITFDEASLEMQEILRLCEQTRKETNGYFDVRYKGNLNPSGLVKGWAIREAAALLDAHGLLNFYVEAGGDVQVRGFGPDGKKWRVGIRNPFRLEEIVQALAIGTEGVATSGTYIRGQHIYDPFAPTRKFEDMVSLTVIGPDIYEADRFATAAFAMGVSGIEFIEKMVGFEGYLIDHAGMGMMTSGFNSYVI